MSSPVFNSSSDDSRQSLDTKIPVAPRSGGDADIGVKWSGGSTSRHSWAPQTNKDVTLGKFPTPVRARAVQSVDQRGDANSPMLPFVPNSLQTERLGNPRLSLPSLDGERRSSSLITAETVEMYQMQSTIEDLNKKLSAVSGELQTVTQERDDLAVVAKDTLTESEIARTSTQTYSNVLVSSTKQMHKLTQQNERLKDELDEKDAELAVLHNDAEEAQQMFEELDDTRQALSELAEKHRSLQESAEASDIEKTNQLEKMRAEMEALQVQAESQAAALRSQIESVEKFNQEGQEKLVLVTAERDKLQEHCDGLGDLLKKAESVSAAAQVDNDTLKQANTALQQQCEAVTAELVDKVASLTSMTEYRSKLNDTVKSLQRQLKSSEAEVASLRAELEAANARLAELEEAIKPLPGLQEAVRVAGEERKAAARTAVEASKALAALREERDSARSGAERTAEALQATEGQLKGARADVARAVAEAEGLGATLKDREARVGTLTMEAAATKDRLEAAQSEVARLVAAAEAQERDVMELCTLVLAASLEGSSSGIDVEAAASDAKDACDALTAIATHVRSLQDRSSAKTAALDAANAAAEERDADLAAVRSELADVEASLLTARANVQRRDGSIAALTQELSEWKNRAMSVSEKVTELEGVLDAAQQAAGVKSKELSAAQAEASKRAAELSTAKEQLLGKEAEAEGIRGQLEEASAVLSRLEEAKEGLHRDLESVRGQAAAAEEEGSALQRAVVDRDREIESLHALLESGNEALDARNAVVQALETREHNLSAKLEKSESKAEQLEGKTSNLQEISSSLQEQLLQADGRIQELVTERDTLLTQLTAATEETAGERRAVKELTAAKSELTRAVASLEQQTADLRAAVATLEEELSVASGDLASERDTVAALEERIRAQADTLAVLRATEEEGRAMYADALSAVEELRGDLEASLQAKEALHQRSLAMERRIGDLGSEQEAASAFIADQLYKSWLTATQAMPGGNLRSPRPAPERDPLSELCSNSPVAHSPRGGASHPLGTSPSMNLSPPPLSRKNSCMSDTVTSAWTVFQQDTLGPGDHEEAHAWQLLSDAITVMHRDAAAANIRLHEESKAQGALNLVQLRDTCREIEAEKDRHISDLQRQITDAGMEVVATAEATAALREQLSERARHEDRIADALRNTETQTQQLEELCMRTERASTEQVVVLQGEIRVLRDACDRLRTTQEGHRGAMARVLAKAQALQQGHEEERLRNEDLGRLLTSAEEELQELRQRPVSDNRKQLHPLVRLVKAAAMLGAAGYVGSRVGPSSSRFDFIG